MSNDEAPTVRSGAVETDERVATALRDALAWGETGLQVAAYLDGELIVDAHAGVADPATGRLVDGSTLFCPFSVTKAIVSTALHVQAERGLIDYDAPITDYWPEYGAHGKGATTVRIALAHRAGIPQMPPDVTPERMCDWQWMTSAVADMTPMYEPGTTNAYHALVWGWLIGELVVRTDPEGRTLDAFVRDEVFGPLGMTDTFLGLPDSEYPRYAPLSGDPGMPVPDPHPVRGPSMPADVAPKSSVHNRRDVLRSVHPGAGSVTTAKSMARLFAMLAGGGQLDGVRLLSEDRVRSFLTPRVHDADIDVVNDIVISISQGGYWLTGPGKPAVSMVGDAATTLYQPGAGGSTGWADLDSRLAVVLCHNRMLNEFVEFDSPLGAIADAVRAVAADRLVRG
jgi:CubicO group peptidase (beta-lactamase class C family)